MLAQFRIFSKSVCGIWSRRVFCICLLKEFSIAQLGGQGRSPKVGAKIRWECIFRIFSRQNFFAYRFHFRRVCRHFLSIPLEIIWIGLDQNWIFCEFLKIDEMRNFKMRKNAYKLQRTADLPNEFRDEILVDDADRGPATFFSITFSIFEKLSLEGAKVCSFFAI